MLNFILGILFAYLILPLTECIVSIANVKTQEYSYKISENVAKIQKNIQKMNLSQQEEEEQKEKIPFGFQTSAIGFEINSEQDQEGEYE